MNPEEPVTESDPRQTEDAPATSTGEAAPGLTAAVSGILPDSPEGRFRLAADRILNRRADALVTGAKGVLDVSEPEPAALFWLAAGRMRTALRLFGPCMPALEARSARKEVTRIYKSVRSRRDADAAIRLCEEVMDEMAPEPAAGIELALDQLRRLQADRNRELARQIHGRRLQALRVRIEDLAEYAIRPVAGEPGDFPPPMEELPDPVLELLLDRLTRLRVLAAEALEPDNRRAQHRMRVAAERLRYLLELTGAALGSQAQTARRSARSLQEILGEIRDADLLPGAIKPAIRRLEEEDIRVVTERGRGSRELDPVLVLAAPNRGSYQGLELALVFGKARRRLLFERFHALWLEQSRRGVWVGLETGIRRKIQAR